MAVRRTLSVLGSFALAIGAQTALAQESFLIDAGPCLSLTTAVERLVCFEQQVREASALQGVAPAVVTNPAPARPAAAPQAPQATQPAPQMQTQPQVQPPQQAQSAPQPAVGGEAAFGLPEQKGPDAPPDEMFGTIASLRQFAPNQVTITLTNGQVWRQRRAERYGLREGQDVRIYATRWGDDFRLSVKDLGGFIQVERVK